MPNHLLEYLYHLVLENNELSRQYSIVGGELHEHIVEVGPSESRVRS
jgi:hypothetical protein